MSGTARAFAVDILKLNTLRVTKTAFLTPNGYDKRPILFIWESTALLYVV